MNKLVVSVLVAASTTAHAGPQLDFTARSLDGGSAKEARFMAITAVIERARPTFLACYASAVAKSPALEGTMNVTFEISVDGSVHAIARGLDPALAACVQAVASKLAFAKQPSRTVIDDSWSFHAHDDIHGTASNDPVMPTVDMGAPTINGAVDKGKKSTIDLVVEQRHAQVFRCYSMALQQQPSLSGSMAVAFTIGLDGAVTDAKLDGLDPGVAACAKSIVTHLKFAKGAEKAEVYYTWTFLQLAQGGAFASLTGTSDISSGFDDANVYGGLLGNEVGYGNGRSGSGSNAATVATVSIGQPTAKGDLDKAIIRRYIKRNIQKIQYCYEKQLLAKPALAGTVAIVFHIDTTGSVSTSTASGVDKDVSECVANVIKQIEFPKPKGTGGVDVNYPITFRPAEAAGPTPPRHGSNPTALPPTSPAPTSTIKIGQPVAKGDLDSAIVRRYLKRNLENFQHCYEKQLLASPKLAGVVNVTFSIRPDGTVVSSKAAGVSADVSSCVAGVITGIEFPKPSSAANVDVMWSVTFTPPAKTP